jgi:hypothetical protein
VNQPENLFGECDARTRVAGLRTGWANHSSSSCCTKNCASEGLYVTAILRTAEDGLRAVYREALHEVSHEDADAITRRRGRDPVRAGQMDDLTPAPIPGSSAETWSARYTC